MAAANLLHNLLIRGETGVPLHDTLRDIRLERLHLRLVPHPHHLELLLQVVLDVVEHLNAPRLLDHQRLLQSDHVPLDGGHLVLLILMLGDHVVLQPAVESLELVDQRIQPGCCRLLLLTGLVGGHNVVGRRGATDRLRHCQRLSWCERRMTRHGAASEPQARAQPATERLATGYLPNNLRE